MSQQIQRNVSAYSADKTAGKSSRLLCRQRVDVLLTREENVEQTVLLQTNFSMEALNTKCCAPEIELSVDTVHTRCKLCLSNPLCDERVFASSSFCSRWSS